MLSNYYFPAQELRFLLSGRWYRRHLSIKGLYLSLVKVADTTVQPVKRYIKNLNFHPLEVVRRYRDPQLQVGENYSYLFNLRPIICIS